MLLKPTIPLSQAISEMEQRTEKLQSADIIAPEILPLKQSGEIIPFRPIKPILAIDNTLRTIDTSETFMEIALQNAAYVIADKLRTDDTITDLIESIRKDFVNKIRGIE